MAVAVGWIGQSNMGVFANHADVTVNPASPADLAHLLFFQPDLFAALDNAGVLTPMAFSAAHIPVSSYDYPPNTDVPRYLPIPGFAAEIYGGLAVRAHLGADIICVKLAPLGSYLTVVPGGPQSAYTESWFNASSHQAWDPALVHSSTPYAMTVLASSVATATSANSMTDAGASWTPGQWSGRWAVMGTRVGFITGNTSTELAIQAWAPLGAPPAPGGYIIQRRELFQASIAKSFLNYCTGASVAAGGGPPAFDMQVVGMALGESDATQANRAALAKANMLSLIWYIRTELVARGLTSKPARQVGFTLSLVKEIPNWPFASLVNQAYREIAAADTFVRAVQVADLPVGGFGNNPAQDGIHYNGPGQQMHGQRHGAGMISLLSQQDTGRASHQFFGRHRVMRPVWGIG